MSEHLDVQDALDDADQEMQAHRHQQLSRSANSPVTEETRLLFLTRVHEIRQLGVRVICMANLYAQVITVAINPGFNKVVEAAYVDCSSGEGGCLEALASAADVIYSKQRTMEDLVA